MANIFRESSFKSILKSFKRRAKYLQTVSKGRRVLGALKSLGLARILYLKSLEF
jgi:hypothetical protein